MCLRNQTKRPGVDRTTVWHGATGSETTRYEIDRPISWHEPNGTVALQTK